MQRLELQAAALATRIRLTVMKQTGFKFVNVTLYLDSKVTLNCISIHTENLLLSIKPFP